jgi:hypothetical protein
MAAYPCRGPIERGYIQHAVVALLEKDRIERVRTTVRTERVLMAVLDFDRRQEDEITECLEHFNANCEYWLRRLLRSAAGCRCSIKHLKYLDKKLADDQTWYGGDRMTAIQLQGYSACLDRIAFDGQGFQTWLDCLVAQPNPKQRDIDLILDWRHVPKSMQDRDLKLWPGDPAASWARLRAIVDKELPRLRALEATLRVQYEEPARAEAEDQALAEVAKEETALLRAARIHEQSYYRYVNTFIKVRNQSSAEPVAVPAPVTKVRWELDDAVPILGLDVPAGSPRAGSPYAGSGLSDQ